jgi:hypothetical protein
MEDDLAAFLCTLMMPQFLEMRFVCRFVGTRPKIP